MVEPYESENGWRPRHATPDLLEWITVPGTNPRVTLQLMKGWPTTVLRAFAADFNAYVEHLRDPDSAAFTPTNKVDTSNHLNGTAMDLNWQGADGKTFRLGISEAVAYPGEKAKNLRDLLGFYEGMVFCGGNWDIRDWMHFQMGANTWNNPKTADFILRKIRLDGFSTYRRGVVIPPAPSPSVSYGLPTGSRINYGAPGFPGWVYDLAGKFGLRASTYPGHQENDRVEAGFERNPAHLNRGIDWAGPVDKMQAFADYCLNIRTSLEQVIWQNPNTGQRIGVAGGKDVSSTGYYASDYGGHRDHVHTRQSRPIPIPGAPPPPPLPPPLSKADQYALEIIAEGRRRGITPRGIQIAFSVVFVESNWKMYANRNVPASLTRPHDAVGSDHDSVGLFQQRFPMWGSLDCLMNAACSAGLFYDRLAKMNYNDPNRLPGSFAADIQRPAAQYRGRYQERFGEAVNYYNRMAGIQPPPPPPPVEEDDFLSALSAEEQREVLAAARNQLAQRKSRSPVRELDEGTVGDSDDQIWDMDSSVHLMVVTLMAMLGHPGQLALLNRIANADPGRYPDRQPDRMVAQAILAEAADSQEMKRNILAALGRVAAAAPPQVFTGEVLPAVRITEPVQSTNTPQDLLDTLDRLKVFDNDYRDKFDDLTKGKK